MKVTAIGSVLWVAMLSAMVLAAGGRSGIAQTIVNPSGQRIVAAGQPVAPVAAPVPEAPKLNEKQRVLADETDKLLEMATDLKTQVGMTNRNILSVKVVRKAEEIEQYAHRIKDEARKP